MSSDDWGWTVVRVIYEYAYPSGVIEGTGGSAVLVSEDGWFLTAGHILWRPEGTTVDRLGVVWPDGSVSDDWSWFQHSTSLDFDFGSFHMRWVPGQGRPAVTALKFPRQHDPVWLMGYPASYSGHRFSEPGRFLRSRVDGHSFVFSLDNRVGRQLRGLSGGAVVTQEGTLLGIFAATRRSALTDLIGYPRPLFAGMCVDGWERHGWRKVDEKAGNTAAAAEGVDEMQPRPTPGNMGPGTGPRELAVREGGSLARAEGAIPAGAIVPSLVDLEGMLTELERYRDRSNFLTRWFDAKMSEARSAQQAQMIEGYRRQLQAYRGFVDEQTGIVESAIRLSQAQAKLALVPLERDTERRLAEMRAQAAIAKTAFESFTLQAESLKEQLLEAEERQQAIRRRQKEQDLRVARLEKQTALHLARIEEEIWRIKETPRRPTRRWDPKETAQRIFSTIDDLDRALQHADRLFSNRDPEMAQDVKQEIREFFRQMWRQQMNEQPPDVEDDWEGGASDGAGYADVEHDDWPR